MVNWNPLTDLGPSRSYRLACFLGIYKFDMLWEHNSRLVLLNWILTPSWRWKKSSDPKKLISVFYNMLLLPSSSRSAHALIARWEEDIGAMKSEESSDALDTCKLVSPKLSDRLTQIYIIHHSYLTQLRVSRYKRDQPANCMMCNQTTGTLYHLLWSCSKIQGFWTQNVQFLHDTMGSPLTLYPKPCLLRIYPEPDMDKIY